MYHHAWGDVKLIFTPSSRDREMFVYSKTATVYCVFVGPKIAKLTVLGTAHVSTIFALELAKASRNKGMIKEILECGNLELMHRVLVIFFNLIENGDECKELILSSGTVAFCEAYA